MFKNLFSAISATILCTGVGAAKRTNAIDSELLWITDEIIVKTDCYDAYGVNTAKRKNGFFLKITQILQPLMQSCFKAQNAAARVLCLSALCGEKFLMPPPFKKGSSAYEHIGGKMRSFAWN